MVKNIVHEERVSEIETERETETERKGRYKEDGQLYCLCVSVYCCSINEVRALTRAHIHSYSHTHRVHAHSFTHLVTCAREIMHIY